MLCCFLADPLCIVFMKCLSLAFFVTDPEDMAAMKTWLKNIRGMTDEEIQNLPMSYFHKRCRRYIPPPLQLAQRLRCECMLCVCANEAHKRKCENSDIVRARLMHLPCKYVFLIVKLMSPLFNISYSAVVDAFEPMEMHNGKRLFRMKAGSNPGMAEVHASVIRHVLKGCVSDPPGKHMYFQTGTTPEGLPVFKGIRSSSELEVACMLSA